MDFKEATDYLFNIPKFTKKNEPEKTRGFLEEIGDISLQIPTIHVAGTNGKGSVCAYLRAGLEKNGLKVGMFTSPHLVSVCERFMIDDEMISEREFVNTFNYIQSMVEEIHSKDGFENYHPTFFEYLFFMAVVWFKSKAPDVIILETGLGGRLDATNAVSKPVLCVITEIGLDHCEYLGDTKEKIAYEKAGIIKKGVPVVYISGENGVNSVIEAVAKEKNSPVYKVTSENIKNLETFPGRVDFLTQSLYDEFVKISLHTDALYQTENASIAFKALLALSELLPQALDMKISAEGLSDMEWPGRMEKLSCGITVDGAHNEDGVNAFLKTVANDGAGKRTLLFSAVGDKNIEAVAKSIVDSNLFEKIVLCTLESYRTASMERLQEAFKGFDKKLVLCDGVKEALGEIEEENLFGTKAYACGSLYLVGEIKTLENEEEK